MTYAAPDTLKSIERTRNNRSPILNLCFRPVAPTILPIRRGGTNTGLHVRRVKQGVPSVHPLQGDEMRALRELKRSANSPFVFTSERGGPFTTAGFAKMVARAGEAAKLDGVHPHMLRHACGYALANRGHDTRALQAYLGHKNIQHTVRYTELSPTRFKDFWR
jgi:site-specific recombinase XerD